MSTLAAIGSIITIALILHDAFEAMLLPRRVSRHLRLTRVYYVNSWQPWAAIAGRIEPRKRREYWLSLFGPLSTLVLIAFWACGLIIGFAVLQWSLGSPLSASAADAGLGQYLYFSGVTFFTLGYGDITPVGPAGRFLAVAEVGIGFGFLAVVISYLPVLYQAFSTREVTISLLDARAGSPPSAAQIFVRLGPSRAGESLHNLFDEWERWAAQLLESHLSFPMLSFYRSQHDNQSWLAALTMILDTSALSIAIVDAADRYRASLTFAMARHAVVDLAQVFQTPPHPPKPDRLPDDRLLRLKTELRRAGLTVAADEAADRKLTELRNMYEPFVNALASYFHLALPPILSDKPPVDNWQTSAWMRHTSGLTGLAPGVIADDHDD